MTASFLVCGMGLERTAFSGIITVVVPFDIVLHFLNREDLFSYVRHLLITASLYPNQEKISRLSFPLFCITVLQYESEDKPYADVNALYSCDMAALGV